MYGGVTRAGIEPFYFGTAGKALFGCYHAPQSGSTRECGIVLCYPMGQEYVRSHRTYRQLAARLSDVGFHLIRFDFYGCGDSDGECEEGGVGQWLADISAAIGEIRKRCGLARVCLVGLRLGGTLSMMVGAERGDVDGMVLWDPVVGGRAYIEELTTLHSGKFQGSHGKSKQGSTAEKPTEILGFPLTDLMLEEMDKIDLFSIRRKPANNILIVESNEEVGQRPLGDHLKNIGAHIDYQRLPGPKIWLDKNKTLVPSQVLQSIVSWISRVCP